MPKFNIALTSRALANMMVIGVFLYLINNYLVYWQGLPGSYVLFSHYGWFGLEIDNPLDEGQISQGWVQVICYLAILSGCIFYTVRTQARTLEQDCIRFAALAAYIIRFAFWTVLLVGFIDMIISFLRVEDFLDFWVGEWLTGQLGRPEFRGNYVHYPLMIISLIIAARVRSISFPWLALMCVFAEFFIVLTRFVFSYEQAYMGDLVRFWYAALFLFAASYTLLSEGHVRVDVLYTGFKRRKKALFDTIGCSVLGMPICWVILMHGMGGRGNSLNSPLLSYEITQSGYGMYVKYLMAAFLIVFAVTMLIQFVSFALYNIGQLLDPLDHEDHASFMEVTDGNNI